MNHLNNNFKILTTVIIFIFLGNNVYAQSKSILKLNFTDLVIGRYSVGYEKSISHSLTLAIDLDFICQNKTLESYHPWYPPLIVTKKGVVVEPQIRFYFKSDDLYGLYTSLSGVLGIAKYKPANNAGYIENDDWSSLGASLYLGYQILLKRIVIDTFFGCTLANDDYPLPYKESPVLFPAPDGLRASGGIKLGFMF